MRIFSTILTVSALVCVERRWTPEIQAIWVRLFRRRMGSGDVVVVVNIVDVRDERRRDQGEMLDGLLSCDRRSIFEVTLDVVSVCRGGAEVAAAAMSVFIW